jgi:choline dehydrogenase
VGTCRMGHAREDVSVVDDHGKLHGGEGVRVEDSSIMRSTPTSRTTIMIAERCAEDLRGGLIIEGTATFAVTGGDQGGSSWLL